MLAENFRVKIFKKFPKSLPSVVTKSQNLGKQIKKLESKLGSKNKPANNKRICHIAQLVASIFEFHTFANSNLAKYSYNFFLNFTSKIFLFYDANKSFSLHCSL